MKCTNIAILCCVLGLLSVLTMHAAVSAADPPATQPAVTDGAPPDISVMQGPSITVDYPGEVPKDPGAAAAQAKKLEEYAKAGKWFGFSAGVIWLLMAAFKWCRKNLQFMKRIPKRAMWIIVPILSIAATVLTYFQAGLTWDSAPLLLLSGPAAGYLNDLIKRGILGIEPTSPVNGPSDSTV